MREKTNTRREDKALEKDLLRTNDESGSYHFEVLGILGIFLQGDAATTGGLTMIAIHDVRIKTIPRHCVFHGGHWKAHFQLKEGKKDVKKEI